VKFTPIAEEILRKALTKKWWQFWKRDLYQQTVSKRLKYDASDNLEFVKGVDIESPRDVEASIKSGKNTKPITFQDLLAFLTLYNDWRNENTSEDEQNRFLNGFFFATPLIEIELTEIGLIGAGFDGENVTVEFFPELDDELPICPVNILFESTI
jgi:hypothetical protein